MANAKDGMAVKLTGAAALELEADLTALPVFEGELRGAGAVKDLDAALDGHLVAAAKAERFEGRADQQLVLPTLGRTTARRVVLLGMGPRPKALDGLARNGFEPLRVAAGRAARAAMAAGAGSLVFAIPDLPEFGDEAVASAARAAVEGVLLGTYRFGRYKRDEDGARRARPAVLQVAVPERAARAREAKDAVALGRTIAGAVAWARDLVNEPPMACTPAALARAAQALAREAGLRVEVRGPKEIAALKMGMFLGVSRGSVEEPRLVTVSHVPRGAGARRPPVVLVGKAITFDSGGLSLKPTDSMVTMNTDMAGSAAVLAAMKVIATLAPPFPVHAVLGACENMPGGRAYKPSDILTAYDGRTVEITNTDAEGRLVLGDVLAWAVETLHPAAIVDVATLTGACVVALGPTTAGLLGPDGPVVEGILAAARAAGEDVWRLPLVEALREELKSDRADLRNTGARHGGAITAAHFLHRFVKDAPWAHLDIAGPSHSGKERGYVAKGGTGFAVRTLVEFVRGWRA